MDAIKWCLEKGRRCWENFHIIGKQKAVNTFLNVLKNVDDKDREKDQGYSVGGLLQTGKFLKQKDYQLENERICQ